MTAVSPSTTFCADLTSKSAKILSYTAKRSAVCAATGALAAKIFLSIPWMYGAFVCGTGVGALYLTLFIGDLVLKHSYSYSPIVLALLAISVSGVIAYAMAGNPVLLLQRFVLLGSTVLGAKAADRIFGA